MKISKEKLKQMIKEELEAVMKETEENLEEATPINKGTAGTRRPPGLTTVVKGDREIDRHTGEDKHHVLAGDMMRDAYKDAGRDYDRSKKRAGRGKDQHSGYKAADAKSGFDKLGESEEAQLEESEEIDEVKAHGGAEEAGEPDKKKMEEAQVEELRESFRRFTKLPKAVLKD
jgi:hypothetical protein